ncbi:MAG: N-acetylmuramoyl-L-alanine amidase [Verrucomicrobiales bacterium]
MMPRRAFSFLLLCASLALWVAGSTPALARSFNTVVIDAGHGAHDFGANRSAFFEKHIALDISRRLERFLRKNGVRTVMTRSTDRFIPLNTRADIGNRTGRCVFVSVHVNDARRSSASGIETFYHTSEGQKLAALVQREILRNTKHGGNRGVKFARFKVLRSSTKPAILVETGFASNREDQQRLRDPRYREAIAQSIGIGLLKYRR